MNYIFALIGYPLGWIMWLCYKIIPNYGIALILFTILTRVALIPTAIKQQQSTVKMALFRPKIEELQKKYANNKQKLNEELTLLYQKEGYSPFSGCLPLLIQMPILFGLIDVIYNPLKHILRMPADVAATAIATMESLGTKVTSYSAQISVIGSAKANPAPFIEALGAETVQRITSIDLSFLGLNLADTPSWALNPLLLIPILAGVTSLLLSVVTMKNTAATAGNDAMAGATSKSMMLMMPLMSVWFTFSMPAGVGFYWSVSNLIMMLQTMLLNKYYNPAEMAEKMKVEMEERRERERQEKIDAKKRARDGESTAALEALSQKEINRQRLAAARKRDAERYGEEYVEVNDKDLD